MSADREALEAKAEAMIERHNEISPVVYQGFADEVAHGYVALLAELETAEAEARDAEWLRGELVAVRMGAEAERDQLRDLCHRAWIALEIYEPDGPLTSELYAALESEEK